MLFRSLIAPRTSEDTVWKMSSQQSVPASAETRAVTGSRRTACRRMAFPLATLIAVGCGGTWLFRVTQAAQAEDASTALASSQEAWSSNDVVAAPAATPRSEQTPSLPQHEWVGQSPRTERSPATIRTFEWRRASEGQQPSSRGDRVPARQDQLTTFPAPPTGNSAAPSPATLGAPRPADESVDLSWSASGDLQDVDLALDADTVAEETVIEEDTWSAVSNEPTLPVIAPDTERSFVATTPSGPNWPVKYERAALARDLPAAEPALGHTNRQNLSGGYQVEARPTPVAPSADSAPMWSAPPQASEPTSDVWAESAQPASEYTMLGDPFVDHPPTMYPAPTCPIDTCTRPACGVHCNGECCHNLHWRDSWMIPWEVFAQGEYIGPSRTPHVPEYRLRVDDSIEFVYRLTGAVSADPYLINTGDTLQIASLTSENLNRDVLVQPDGTISLSQLGQVIAAGRSISELRSDLEERYGEFVRNPSITVSPLKLNTVLEELRATVDNRFGSGGQSRITRITPEGTVQLPAIGSVPAHGLTLAELGAEIEFRYADIVNGLEVTPILFERAPHYVYVLGEVRTPGRYTLEGPTTLMQSVALAGGWNVGANLTQVVVFRRDECWRLMATKVGIRAPLYGKDPCPDGELWLRDADIVVVPKSPILVADEFIDLVFTRGIYGVIPFNTNLSIVRSLSSAATTVIPVGP